MFCGYVCGQCLCCGVLVVGVGGGCWLQFGDVDFGDIWGCVC